MEIEIPIEYQLIHKLSYLNRLIIEKSELVGCFYCRKIFASSLIVEWCDQHVKRGGDGIMPRTALCPSCSIDSVIPYISGCGTREYEELLEKIHSFYFGELNEK